MTEPFIVDAHLHLGRPGVFFSPESGPEQLLALMDMLSIRFGIVAGDHLSICEGCDAGSLAKLSEVFAQSQGRLLFLGVFNPQQPDSSLATLQRSFSFPGFAGVKIHPSFHRVWADDQRYEAAWRFAAIPESSSLYRLIWMR